MRLLLVDHGNCDHDHTRVHGCRDALRQLGVTAAVCATSSITQLEQRHPGMYGIHLHAIAAASHRFLAAVQTGTPDALLATTPLLPPRLLGLVRETARQLIAEAVDAINPDVIFVMHAGILTDLAVETGAPVVVHVAKADLDSAAARPQMRALVRRAIGSCERIVAADDPTVAALRTGWIDGDDAAVECWPIAPSSARLIADVCAAAVRRRRG